MLIDFTFKNFLSFKDEKTFSLVAANSVKEMENEVGESNVVTDPAGNRFLRIAAVYGANASGKSNLIEAMAFFRVMILSSFQDDSILRHYNNYFRLDDESSEIPSSFEMNFSVGGKIFRYGFEVFHEQIESEWLFETDSQTQRESYCFNRTRKNIKVNPRTFKGTRGLTEKTRNNALFLSTTAQFNVAQSMSIKEWFRKDFNILSGLDETIIYTARQYMHDAQMQHEILDFIHFIDLGIKNISVTDEIDSDTEVLGNSLVHRGSPSSLAMESSPNSKNVHRLEITTTHDKYSDGKVEGEESFPFKLESLGTKKAFAFLGPWFDTLRKGGVLIVDEYGTSLHTKLAKELIKLFQSKINSKGAQLIVATHDTNLLHKDLLRRDQIWFVEKNKEGESDLYSLVEYKVNQATSVRNDASFSKDYLAGKYGAIPFFGDIKRFINEYSDDKQVSE